MIVGESPLDREANLYLANLRQRFGFPIEYEQLNMQRACLVSPSGTSGEARFRVTCSRATLSTGSAHEGDLKVHLVWIPKYRKPVLTGEVATRVRDLIRQIAAEHELEFVSGKVARDHVVQRC